jgi:hypothetical protein
LRLVEAVSRWPRWRGRLVVREWEPEDHPHPGAPVVVDGRFPVDPVNVKTVRAALEQADALEPLPQQPTA